MRLNPSGTTLVYATYLGGSGGDIAQAVAVDASGAAYVTGYTYSTNFPTASAYQSSLAGLRNAFETKLSPSGAALVYGTYLGGSGAEEAYGIAVDGAGAAYVTGWTGSTDFPTASAFQGGNAGSADAFIAKLSPSGTTLSYASYLGGSNNDEAYGIAVDGAGAAYVTGLTSSTDFPTACAYQAANAGCLDAFIVKRLILSNGTI